MIVWVKFFAAAKQRAGTQAASFAMPDGSFVRDLRAAMKAEYPSLGELLPHCRIAVDCDFAGDDLPLNENQEIGVIPPVSGG